MLTLVFPVILLAGYTAGRHVVHFYNASRDYLDVTSENYPETYPSGNTYTWEWSAQSGYWGVYFVDFDLVCDEPDVVDRVSVKTYQYRCKHKPPELYFKSTLKMELHTKSHERDSNSRGFKCHVFYGENQDDVESRINAMKAMGNTIGPTEIDNATGLSGIEVALILIIGVLIIAVSVVACVVIRRRRQHQQTTTNTSVHVNIDGIRSESSTSYTRNGGARPRLESEDSIPDNTATTKTRRPVKRSESNASWAARAEMATSARTAGSCSSEGHHDNTTIVNFYAPFPSSDADNIYENCLGDADPLDEKDIESSKTGRLSSISEESSASKVRKSQVIPLQLEATSLAIDNTGYMVMSGCAGNYVNYDGE
ncbi:uncharacterized protein [Littorina saxatilis]|uniref:CUB domain-containing protein n=1 Tax=Littorina saxatilis TaxID=31220 RepID=A0AAN9AKL6_9CAEN